MENLFNYVLQVFIFLSPIFYFRDYQLSTARGMFFVLGTFVLFSLSLAVEQKRKFSNKWVSLIVLLAFIRIFFDNKFQGSEWFNFWFSCAGFIYVLCGAMLFYVVYCYSDNIRDLFMPVCYVAVLNSILVLAQLFKYDFMWTNALGINGFMDTPSQLGQYSAMSLPILFYFNPLLTIFPLFTLIASKSISPILASVLGIGLLGGFKGKIWKIKLGIGILLVTLVFFNFSYITSKWQCRPERWKTIAKIALQKPFLGWGYRTYNEKVMQLKEKDSLSRVENQRPHNDYLHTAQELGFPIVIVFIIFLIKKFKKFCSMKKDRLLICLFCSVLIVLINMGAQSLIRYASMAGTFIVLLALLCRKVDDGNRTPD